MHAIIMGAGEGTRMWPISTIVNKHLLKLGGKPVIRHIVDKITNNNTRKWRLPANSEFQIYPIDITILCLQKDVKDYKWEFRDIPEINFYPIDYNTGTATEFWEVLDRIKVKDENALLHYGDTITDLDYGHFMRIFKESKSMNAMIAVTENIRHDYSKVDCGTNVPGAVSIVQKMEEKPLLSFPSWTGIAIFKTKFIQEFLFKYAFPTPSDFGYDILPKLVEKGELYAYQYDGKWFDVGNLRSYQKLYKEYQNKDLNL